MYRWGFRRAQRRFGRFLRRLWLRHAGCGRWRWRRRAPRWREIAEYVLVVRIVQVFAYPVQLLAYVELDKRVRQAFVSTSEHALRLAIKSELNENELFEDGGDRVAFFLFIVSQLLLQLREQHGAFSLCLGRRCFVVISLILIFILVQDSFAATSIQKRV